MLQTKVFFQLYKCVTLTSPEAYIGAQWVLLSVKSNRVIMSQIWLQSEYYIQRWYYWNIVTGYCKYSGTPATVVTPKTCLVRMLLFHAESSMWKECSPFINIKSEN